MARVKQTQLAPKKSNVSLLFAAFRFLLIFLAATGDITIESVKGIVLLFKIAQKIYPRLVAVMHSILNDWSAYLRAFNFYAYKRVLLLFLGGRNKTHALFSIIHHVRTLFIYLSRIGKKPSITIFPTRRKLITVSSYQTRNRTDFIFIWGTIVGVVASILFIFIPYNIYVFIRNLPNPRLLSQRFIPITTQIYDRNDELLYEIHGDEYRIPTKLEEVPQIVKQATIAIEDKNFYEHKGISFTAIARATRETFLNNNVQGGSTITQQLIKNALLTPEVSVVRKAREILLAFWAERIYTKEQILEMYLNQVPYGGTSWGIGAAAKTYFGKNVSDLSLAEASYLAGLPAGPSIFSPYSRPDLAKKRQVEVLTQMATQGYITREQASETANEPITIKPNVTNIKAPHFVMYIRDLVADRLDQRLVNEGGLRITTTLDLNLHEKIQGIVTNHINELTRLNVSNGAVIVTNPQNGDILAMVGSTNYFDTLRDGNVNVVLSPRQPGSSIKPITYVAALEKGMTAATVLEDSPVVYTSPGSPPYAPENYDRKFHGLVTVRTALGNSFNVPAVRTLHKIGIPAMVDTAKRMGVTTWNDSSRFGLALTLGGGEVTLFDLATVYGTLANQGYRVELNPIITITDYTGKTYYRRDYLHRQKAVSPEIAFIISDILSDNGARSQTFGYHSNLVIPNKIVAVKTGTTNDKRDNWTIGYTPSYVAGVWVGNNDNSPMDPYLTSGVTGATPIWFNIMTELLRSKHNEPFYKPATVVSYPCRGRNEYFVHGTEPKNGCRPLSSPSPNSDAE